MSEELLLDLSTTDAKPAKATKKAAAKKVAAKKVATKKVVEAPASVVAEAPAPKKVAAKKVAAKKAAKTKEVAPEPEAKVEAPPVAEVAAKPAAKLKAEAPEAESNGTKKPKPARKSAILKKAAEMLAQMQAAEAAGKPVAEEAVKALVAVVEKAPVTEAAPQPAPVAAEAPAAQPAPVEAPVAQQAAPAPRSEANTQAPAHPQGPAGEGQPQERRKSKFERWKERRERFRQEKIARQQAGGNGGGGAQPNGQHRNGNPNGESQSGGDEDRGRIAEVPLGPPEPADGILELTPKGYGFLRQRDRMYIQHPNDAFISGDFIRQYGLREGMQVVGIAQKGQRGAQITSVSEVNGRAPEAMRDLPLFEELKAINPNKKIQLETVKDRFTTRVIDMFTPVGRGQRGLIVAPPRAGKTTILQHIAEAVITNHPNMHLMILLVDERPEEVTEFKRILPKAEIYASSNDQDIKSHTRIAAFAVERAKRLVECGEHVFMLMDSITRLARAFNNAKSGGATMSGGMGVGAMEIPRRLFAAARNTRQAGSLTVLATALVETGSRMDDLIFQEFKGTGNMELVLDRKIAEQFYYPAVNIFKSGTRREELLLQPFQLDKIHMLRRGLAGHKPIDAIQRVLQLMERYPSNAQMLVDLPNKS